MSGITTSEWMAEMSRVGGLSPVVGNASLPPSRGSLYRRGSVWWLNYRDKGTKHCASLRTRDRQEADSMADEFLAWRQRRDRAHGGHSKTRGLRWPSIERRVPAATSLFASNPEAWLCRADVRAKLGCSWELASKVLHHLYLAGVVERRGAGVRYSKIHYRLKT